MGKFTLEIELGNDSMNDCHNLSEALAEVAARIARYEYPADEELVRGIIDENGNHVGSWKIEP